jgi:hypothetical protein
MAAKGHTHWSLGVPTLRLSVRVIAALLFVWAAYFVSPYVSFYQLAKAVEAKDSAALAERVNFKAVRASIANQVIPAYLIATGRGSEAKGERGQALVGMGATIADPILAEYISPEKLANFLAEPQALPGKSGGGSRTRVTSLRDAWLLFATAQARGFRAISFTVPPGEPIDQQFRLQMRISGLGWQLVGIQVPKPILDELVQEVIKRNPATT